MVMDLFMFVNTIARTTPAVIIVRGIIFIDKEMIIGCVLEIGFSQLNRPPAVMANEAKMIMGLMIFISSVRFMNLGDRV